MKLTKLTLQVIESKAEAEDIRRREGILTIFILSTVALFSVALIVHFVTFLSKSDSLGWRNGALSFGLLFVLVSYFAGQLIAAKRGFVHSVSLIFVSSLFLFSGYLSFEWGVDLPSALMLYALTIVTAGMLLGTRYALLFGFASFCLIMTLGVMQQYGHTVNAYWRSERWTIADSFVTGCILFIISIVSWLSNREIERSLARARRSEADLKTERDMLEVRVEERTRELRKAEMERMRESYRFVEFGRLAGGLLHDLGNPLTALALNIESIASHHKHQNVPGEVAFAALSSDIERAQSIMIHMRRLMESTRRHFSRTSDPVLFSIGEVAAETVRVFESYARLRCVALVCVESEEVMMFGDSVALTHVLGNLISNAIEAFGEIVSAPHAPGRRVTVRVSQSRVRERAACIEVEDNGPGIPPEMFDKIFDPFFTDNKTGGLGIGLPLARRTVEKEFGGTLSVDSVVGKGSTFRVCFPLKDHEPIE